MITIKLFIVLSEVLKVQTKPNFAQPLQTFFVKSRFQGPHIGRKRIYRGQSYPRWKDTALGRTLCSLGGAAGSQVASRLDTKQFGLPKPKGPRGRQALWLLTVFCRRAPPQRTWGSWGTACWRHLKKINLSHILFYKADLPKPSLAQFHILPWNFSLK